MPGMLSVPSATLLTDSSPLERGNAARFTERRKRAFLKALRYAAGNMQKAADVTRIGFRTVYDHLNRDPDFAVAVRLIKRQLANGLVDVAYQRAATPEGFSDRKMLLQAWLPEEFGERSSLSINIGVTPFAFSDGASVKRPQPVVSEASGASVTLTDAVVTPCPINTVAENV